MISSIHLKLNALLQFSHYKTVSTQMMMNEQATLMHVGVSFLAFMSSVCKVTCWN